MLESRRPSNATSGDSSSTIPSSLGLLISNDDLLALANDDVDFWMSLHSSEHPFASSSPSPSHSQPLFRLLRDPIFPSDRPAKQRCLSTLSLAQPVPCELSPACACATLSSPSPSPSLFTCPSAPPSKPRPIAIPLPRLTRDNILQSPVVKPLTSPSLVSPLFLPPIQPESLPSLASSSSTSTSAVFYPFASSHSNGAPPDSFSPDEPLSRKSPFPPLESPLLEKLANVVPDNLHLLAGLVAQEARQRRPGQRQRTKDKDAEMRKDGGMRRVKCWVEHRRGRRARVA